jgi:hypothetical protein
LIVLVFVPAWLAGCTTEDVVGPEPTALAYKASAAASGSIAGDWNYTRVVQITAPAWVAAAIFGVTPEGPVTHIRCEGAGTLDLDQSGRSFDGTASGAGSTCRTRGGQVFAAGYPNVEIVGGTIRGQSMSYTRVEPDGVFCTERGVIAQTDGMVATRLSGTGRCTVPGHPKSPVPLDPPPGGTSKVISWEAWRP